MVEGGQVDPSPPIAQPAIPDLLPGGSAQMDSSDKHHDAQFGIPFRYPGSKLFRDVKVETHTISLETKCQSHKVGWM